MLYRVTVDTDQVLETHDRQEALNTYEDQRRRFGGWSKIRLLGQYPGQSQWEPLLWQWPLGYTLKEPTR